MRAIRALLWLSLAVACTSGAGGLTLPLRRRVQQGEGGSGVSGDGARARRALKALPVRSFPSGASLQSVQLSLEANQWGQGCAARRVSPNTL